MAQHASSPADYIKPLDMDGLAGRMLRLPAPAGKTSEILFVYGQHSSLERWWGLLSYINRYAAVTAPDLPGFGGMDSFYKIGKKPTLDNFADYLAAFVKLRYRRKKVMVVGMSLGFVIATRMLQRYPELAKNVTVLVSLAGMTHHEDFVFSKSRYRFYRSIAFVCSFWLPSLIYRYVMLNSFILRRTYHHTTQAKAKFAQAHDALEHKHFMDVEIDLWHRNDVRTHARTLTALLALDNCRKQLDVPVWHIDVAGDQYLDHHRTLEHMRIAFKRVHVATSHMKAHAPSIIADEAAAAPMIPSKLRRVLAKLP